MLTFSLMNIQEILGCSYSKKLLHRLHSINLASKDAEKIDIQEVEKGMVYAKYYHGNQLRASGEPYYTHPFEVAYMVADYLPRTDMIITAILHDTIEDTSLTREEIEEVFGSKISEQVYDLTRIKEDGGKISSAQMVEELWLEGKKDLLVIKMCDRIHNMKTISSKSMPKIKSITNETICYFLTLAIALESLDFEDYLVELCLEAMNQEQELSYYFLQSCYSSHSLPQVFENSASQNNNQLKQATKLPKHQRSQKVL